MIRFFVFVVAATIFSLRPCTAQMNAKQAEKKEEDKKSKREAFFENERPKTILETTIDEKQYQVGPGDELLISVLGQVNEFFRIPISPEGKVVVPSVSVIDVKELLLIEAKKKIITEIRKVYPTVDVSVDIVALRQFRIHVTGAVTKSGAVTVSGVDRVSYAIEQAEQSVGSMRNIVVKNQNGRTKRADLIRKRNTGSLEADPFLSEGDVIYVPNIYAQFYIWGSVHVSGPYEFVQGERLSDVILLSGGLSFGADSLEAQIVRFKQDTGRTFERIVIDLVHILKNPTDTTENLLIHPDDRIFIRQKYLFHPKANITINGEVVRPGEYAIQEGVTKITDVITQAGGFTPDVAIEGILIYRHRDIEGIDVEFERLKKIPYNDMNKTEKAYFKAKSRQELPPVQTDFSKLFEGGRINETYNVLLKPYDLIQVTRIKKTVTLVGGIIHAGVLDYIPGKNYKYYIEKAGGYTKIAKKGDVTIIKSFGQQWNEAEDNAKIDDGDVIFVPEKEPIDGWQLFKDVLAIAGQVAAITSTLILVIYTVKNY